MVLQIDVVPGRHELVRLRMQSLLHALDHPDAEVEPAFTRFVETIEAHAALEYHLEYRTLTKHASPSVRASAERLLQEQPNFSTKFDAFARRWHRRGADALRSDAFREDLDQVIASIVARIKLEERIVAALASAA